MEVAALAGALAPGELAGLAGRLAGPHHVDDLGVQGRAGLVEVLHVAAEAALVAEVLAAVVSAVVQADAQPRVEEGQLLQAAAEHLVDEGGGLLEDLGVGREVHPRAAAGALLA
ncbi:MAG: hypothetical protein ACK559_07270, partial [bacterium]